MDVSSVVLMQGAAIQSDGARAVAQASVDVPSIVTPTTAATGPDATTQGPSTERIAQAVNQVNIDFTQRGQNISASIEIDRGTGINVVKFIDNNTKEVVGQFPSKLIITMAEAIDQNKGRLLNVSA